ncbi:MAG TPA: HAD-IA family hydrolase, partial [Gemmatimonadales bacterium]
DLAAAANRMLAHLGLRALPEGRIPALIGDGVDQLVSRVLAASAGPRPAPRPAEAETARALFHRLYGEQLFERSRVYPGVHAGLAALRRAGLRLCCITNKAACFARPLLEAAQLAAHFDFTLCPEAEDDRKPSPKLLLAACRRLGVGPAELLFVGDSRTDVGAARAAGCRVIAVDYGYHRGAPEELGADARIGSVTDLLTHAATGPLLRKSSV